MRNLIPIFLLSAVLCVVEALRPSDSVRAPTQPGFLPVGSMLHPLPTLNPSGRPCPWPLQDGRPVLLIVHSAHCPSCEQSVPAWVALQEAIAPPGVTPLPIDIVCLSTTCGQDAAEFLERHGLTGELLCLDASLEENPRFRVVPQTILVDEAGRVFKNTAGLVQPESLPEFVEEWRLALLAVFDQPDDDDGLD